MSVLTAAAPFVVNKLLPRFDQRIEESAKPFDRPGLLRPHPDSRTWAWTHYGIFVPELPRPHRYLNTMTLIGSTGAVCFDNDYLAASDARRTTTVLSSTAAPGHHHYQAYDSRAECRFAEDSSRLEWDSDLAIEAAHPSYQVHARYDGFSADLAITATPRVSWFVRNPAYAHLSLLATFTGRITDDTGETEIGGLCTVEYARSLSPQALRRSPLPPRFKLPVDFFTYQIINLDDRTQLLLTDVRAAGATACRLAHLRTLDGAAAVYREVRVEVRHRAEPEVDPRGREMRVPERFKWIVRDGGEEIVAVEAIVDSPLRYGHGRGYVGAYTYSGAFRGRPVSGSGYFEWVDCEVNRARR